MSTHRVDHEISCRELLHWIESALLAREQATHVEVFEKDIAVCLMTGADLVSHQPLEECDRLLSQAVGVQGVQVCDDSLGFPFQFPC